MRAWFMGKHAREKFLLLGLLVAAAVLWANDLTQRLGTTAREVTVLSSNLQTQQQWLDNRERIEAEARAAVEDLDSSRTFNSVALSAELSTIAEQTGIAETLRSSAAGTQQTAQFSVHQVELTLTRVPWENLLQFYEALSQRAPYISIEQFRLFSVRSDTSLLNAQLLVSSVEITTP
ncbi:hypothetical protein [Actomonas aquatica]|uniref:General secretion pathway protein GspM n=1 Tax=Actomonas aquatica TaxID=2866162 RepID=A0ABZ1C6G2_9BACT|nr:hypothetical protein [Opitutus sp. WL0086]WRQ87002.1 hypothetical protein K1X11_019485 [Opitutus sp. WL0086]